MMYAEMGIGNGKIDYIRDVVYVDPDLFDKTKTRQMATEINKINSYFELHNKEYILIGPGRWGSRDPFTGIPVLWAHISKARIIVETGLPDFVDALWITFLSNVTSMMWAIFSTIRDMPS